MQAIRHFKNERIKKRSTYLIWLLVVVAILTGLQFLLPIIKPNRYSGSAIEWVFISFSILLLISDFVLHKRFVSISFNSMTQKITLTTTTLIRGTKTNDYNYTDIRFEVGKDPASFRKASTGFIKLYSKTQKLIKLEKTSIGESTFEDILTELQQLQNPPDNTAHINSLPQST